MRDLFNRIPGPMSPMERDLKERREHRKALRELDEFKGSLIKLVENYIKMIDMKIHSQDLKIDKTLKELTEDVIETSKSIVNTAMETGAVTIEPVYDPEVEMLSYAMRTVVPDTPVEPEQPTKVTFTIDGKEYDVDSGTIWQAWADSGNGAEQGYTTEAGGVVETNYGQTVRTANGVKVDNTKEIESGDYYCTTFIFIENSGSRNIISFYGDPDFEGYTDTWGTFADYTGWIIFDPDNPDQFVRTVGSKEYVEANDTILAGVYEFTTEPPKTDGDSYDDVITFTIDFTDEYGDDRVLTYDFAYNFEDYPNTPTWLDFVAKHSDEYEMRKYDYEDYAEVLDRHSGYKYIALEKDGTTVKEYDYLTNGKTYSYSMPYGA